MPLNRDRVGHRYPSYRYEVSRAKIREYAVATGVDDPALARAGGRGRRPPPTFAACFTIALEDGAVADPELGAHRALVHGTQEYEFSRPVRAGDVLECTPEVAGIAAAGRNELLTVQVDCVDAATGEPVVTGRSVIVFLGSAPRRRDGVR